MLLDVFVGFYTVIWSDFALGQWRSASQEGFVIRNSERIRWHCACLILYFYLFISPGFFSADYPSEARI